MTDILTVEDDKELASLLTNFLRAKRSRLTASHSIYPTALPSSTARTWSSRRYPRASTAAQTPIRRRETVSGSSSARGS